jgi:hypothetical protein
MCNNKNFPVDAVITWVDSTDVVWQNNINKYLENKLIGIITKQSMHIIQ